MTAHSAFDSPLILLLVVAVSVVAIYYVVRWIRRSLGRLGLTHGEVGTIIWLTFIGGFIDIPLFRFGEGFLGVNVGGAVVPVGLSLYLIKRKRLALGELLVGIPVVALVTYLVTDYVPGLGVISEFPFWLLPAFAAFVLAGLAYWQERQESASYAYVIGTMGVLIGADLVRIPEILAGPAPAEGAMLSMGGAAVFDMVYLTGIIAVTMETGLLTKLRQNLSAKGRGNPIEDEYQAWVEKKRREWADTADERRRLDAVKDQYRTPGAPGRTQQPGAQRARPGGRPETQAPTGPGAGRGPRPREWHVQRSGP